ncbi:MAG: TetR/AcrR family transcriptional regulator [Patulibacter sp.]|nr:TetR/AcrR family transcriptional regulator [Patulibacter sp.]
MPNDDYQNASRCSSDIPLPDEAQSFRQRAHLIDAAVREIADRGYDGATVASITTRAGLSRPAFYEQFASKEEALVHAYDVAIAFAAPRILEAMRSAGGWQNATASALAMYLAILDCDHAWALVCLQETSAAGEPVRRARDTLRAPIIEAFRRLSTGDVPGPVDGADVISALDAIAIDGLRHRPGQPLAVRQRELTQFVLAAISGGAAPGDVDLPPLPPRRRPERVEALIEQGEEVARTLELLVRAAAARRDGPTLWRVIVALQRRRAVGRPVDEALLRMALEGIRDAWFFGLPIDEGPGASGRE